VIGSGLTVASILLGLHWGALSVAISYSVVQVALITPIFWWFCCRRGSVRVRDLLAVAAPIWLVCVVTGGLFEAFRIWVLPGLHVALPAVAGILLAFLWIVTCGAALLSLHPLGRDLLGSAVGALRALSPAGRAKTVPSSPHAS